MKINQENQESMQIDVILAMAGLQHPRWASAPGPEAEVMLGAWHTARAGLALARALASELGFSLRARGSGHVRHNGAAADGTRYVQDTCLGSGFSLRAGL